MLTYNQERGKTMSETTEQSTNKQGGGSKRLIAIILIVILIIGASVTAYAFLNKSEKEKYFLAEKKSSELISDTIEQRFGHEIEWKEKTEDNPSEATYDLSAQMDSGSGFSSGLFSPEQIVNNSKLTVSTAKDLDEKIVSTGLGGSIAGVEIDDFNIYLTSEELLVELPFEDDVLQIKGESVGHILHALDPYSVEEDLELDFNAYFDWANGRLSEDDKEYFKEEYLEMIYDHLPEDAFAAEKDKITINDESINAEKITMHLSEDEVKELLTMLVKKTAEDPVVKEKLDDLYHFVNVGESMDPSMPADVEEFIAEFEEGLDEAVDEIEDLSIPEGMKSTIWVDKDRIVQREFQLDIGSSETDLVTLILNGTQQLDGDKQSFDYEYTVEDGDRSETVFLLGDFALNDNETTDSLEFSFDDSSIRYESSETLDDQTKDFDRTFTFDDAGQETKLLWTGSATYDDEEMSASHELSVEDFDINSDMFSILIEKDAQLVKDVDIPSDENKKDLGDMDERELQQYFEYDLPTQLDEWLYGNMDMQW